MPPELPQGWRWVRLGEVLTGTFSGVWGYEADEAKGYPVIRSTEIKNNGQLDLDKVSFREIPSAKVDKYTLKDGDLLVVSSGGTTGRIILGRCAIFTQPSNRQKYLFSNFLKLLRIDRTLILPEFAFWYLNSETMQRRIQQIYYQTTGIQNLPWPNYLNSPIPLPPLPEQKRIATKVQELMKDIERARIACEARLEATKDLPQAYLRQVFESEEAKKWERRRLGELFDIQQGVAMSPYRREGVSAHPFLRTLNVLWGRVDLSTVDKMDFTDEEVSRLSLKHSDLLVCEGGEVGRTAIWRGGIDICLYQNHIHRLRKINDTVVPEFYMYWMQVAFQVFKSYSGEESTTTIPNLSGNRLKSFLVPLPPPEKQRCIATELQAKIEEAEKLQASIKKQLEAINALPQAILRKAFSGEL